MPASSHDGRQLHLQPPPHTHTQTAAAAAFYYTSLFREGYPMIEAPSYGYDCMTPVFACMQRTEATSNALRCEAIDFTSVYLPAMIAASAGAEHFLLNSNVAMCIAP